HRSARVGAPVHDDGLVLTVGAQARGDRVHVTHPRVPAVQGQIGRVVGLEGAVQGVLLVIGVQQRAYRRGCGSYVLRCGWFVLRGGPRGGGCGLRASVGRLEGWVVVWCVAGVGHFSVLPSPSARWRLAARRAGPSMSVEQSRQMSRRNPGVWLISSP